MEKASYRKLWSIWPQFCEKKTDKYKNKQTEKL